MKTLLIISTFVFFTQSIWAGKRHHKAHSHGEGKLTLAIDGPSLEIEIEVPANDIVGFEHQATTESQKKSVLRVEAQLKKAEQMIGVPDKAQCTLVKAQVNSSLNEKSDKHHHGDHHDEKKETHSEFHINYKFKCEAPEYLSRVTVNLFKFFPSLKELKGQAVTMTGQFAKEVTSRSNTFSFTK